MYERLPRHSRVPANETAAQPEPSRTLPLAVPPAQSHSFARIAPVAQRAVAPPPLQLKGKGRRSQALWHGSLAEFQQLPLGAVDNLAAVRGVRRAEAAQPGLGYRAMMTHVSDFLDPNDPVQPIDQPNGPQFIQHLPNNVARRVGADVNPENAHVQQLGPHLNLQSQLGGVVQGGALQDPHHAVASADPFPAQHPLHGLSHDEQSGFINRYVHSTFAEPPAHAVAVPAPAQDDDEEDMGLDLFK